MRPVISLSVLAVAALLALPAQAQQNHVVNGGFEASVVAPGSWVQLSQIDGWRVVAGNGFEVRNEVAGSAHEGSNFIELDTNGNTRIEQVLQLVAGRSYELSFAYAARPGVAANTNGVRVYWNGQALTTDAITGSGMGAQAGVWHEYRFTLTASGLNDVLSFAAVGRSDGYGGSLDSVRLMSSVPEPTSYALMLGGLFAIALLKRRRQPMA